MAKKVTTAPASDERIVVTPDNRQTAVLNMLGTVLDKDESVMLAGIEDEDIMYVRMTILAEGENANRDEVTREFMLNRFQSAVSKPVTMQIDANGRPAGHWKLDANGQVITDENGRPLYRNDNAIGSMVRCEVVEDPDTQEIKLDAVAGIWKKMKPTEAELMRSEYTNNRLYFSIEIDLSLFERKANGGRLCHDGTITAVAVVGNPAYGPTASAHDLRASTDNANSNTDGDEPAPANTADDNRIAASVNGDAAQTITTPKGGENNMPGENKDGVAVSEMVIKNGDEFRATVVALNDTTAKLTAEKAQLEAQLAERDEKIKTADEANAALKAENETLKATITEKDKAIEEANAKIADAEKAALRAERVSALEKIEGEALTDEYKASLGDMSADKFEIERLKRENASTTSKLSAAVEAAQAKGVELPQFTADAANAGATADPTPAPKSDADFMQ